MRNSSRSCKKHHPCLPQLTNQRTADQAFNDATSKIVLDNQFQNKVANLEQQVLEAKKVTLQKQLQTLFLVSIGTPEEKPASNSNFGLFYKYEGEESHLVLFMREYQSVDI